MTPEQALADLKSLADTSKIEQMAAYHKVDREYLGVANPQINEITTGWRQSLTLEQRLEIAEFLWGHNSHEGRIAAAKLLTQARIKNDEPVWELIKKWVTEFDAWAIADHVASAGSRRLTADPSRLDHVETWTKDDNFWVRRVALVMTLPWCKSRDPKPAELEQRERILGWAAGYVTDKEWFIQKSVAWWLRDLSKRDPERVAQFITEHGIYMKKWARIEAAKLLPTMPELNPLPVAEPDLTVDPDL